MAEDRRQPARAVGVEIVQDISRISSPMDGFLQRHRLRAKTLLSDGTRTETYVVDYVDRDARRRDAVAVAAYCPPPPGESSASALVLLRRQLRYPAYLVAGAPLLTEVVAGLMEAPEPPIEAARRELYEETGLDLEPSRFAVLGPPFFPSPGAMTERIFVVCAELPESVRALDSLAPAPGDGSPMEEGAEVLSMSLGDALWLLDAPHGEQEITIEDAKTEIALRRLAAALGGAR